MTEPRMAYVYRVPGCGCVVAAQVDDRAYARDVARFKRDKSHTGFVLEHMTVDQARAIPWGWPCEHMKAGGNVGEPQLAMEVPA